jgi:hypothetical protein
MELCFARGERSGNRDGEHRVRKTLICAARKRIFGNEAGPEATNSQAPDKG